MGNNEDMYKEQAEAERLGLERNDTERKMVKGEKTVERVKAKRRLMKKYPTFPGNIIAIRSMLNDTDMAEDFRSVLDVEEAANVTKMTALMVSEVFNDSALIMAYSEIIGDFYDSLVEGDDDEGEAILIALQAVFKERGVDLMYNRLVGGNKDGTEEISD